MAMLGLITLLIVISSSCLQRFTAQADAPCTTDTWGQEFYLAVFKPESSHAPDYSPLPVVYTLHVLSKGSGRLTISAPGVNYHRSSYLSKGVRSFALPDSVQTLVSSGVNNTGIKVTTTVDVTLTVFASAGDYYSAAALILPKPVLSTEYIVPYGNHEVLVVSTRNATSIDATRYYVSNQLLEEHEVYHLSHRSSSSTDSTIITSNHPIAVYIIDATFKGSFYEQMIPTKSWGYRYIVPEIYDDRHYIFQAIASEHNTYINTYHRAHPSTMYLTRGKMVGALFEISPYVLTSSKPFMVMQSGGEGAFMTNIPAISQFSNSYSLYIPPEFRSFSNNIIIITPEQDEGGITFDAPYIPHRQSSDAVYIGNVKYVTVTYGVTTGELRIFHTSPNGKFGGILYGYNKMFSHYKSYYALPLGLMLKEEGCVPQSTTTATVAVSSPSHFSHANDTVCFACQDMSSLVFCDHVQTCNSGEKCFVEKYLTSGGETKYSSGCLSSSICSQTTASGRSCRQCCSGSYCNSAGCGDASTPSRDQRGPFCYDCDHVGRAEDCHRVTLCKSDQVCSIRKYSWGDTLSHFSLGCADKSCVASSNTVPLGRKRSVPACEQCCTNDFCNKYCTQTNGLSGTIIG